ncbi:hypothetical protein EYV94_08405 [Puteibacter caeruleilacunae]|nr:hypothetical protein EYV94_08405 [Puteibacter caeruleilacunae]
MKKRKNWIWLFLLLPFIISCEREMDKYYDVEVDEGGTVYAKLAGNEEFSIFTHALELCEYSDVLGKSGLFTVLAVDNDNFNAFLQAKGYSKVDDVPVEELKRVMTNHIIEWSYSAFDLTHGYLDDENPDDPQLIRKMTRSMEPIRKEMLTVNHPEEGEAEYEVNVVSENKMLTFLSKDYIDNEGIPVGDITTFFPNNKGDINGGDILVGDAYIVESDISVLNGWIHVVSDVMEPRRNLNSIIQEEDNYSLFKNAAWRFAMGDNNEYYTEYYGYPEDDFLENLFTLKWYSLDEEFVGKKGEYPSSTEDAIAIQKTMNTVTAPNNTTFQAFLDDQFGPYYDVIPDDIPDFAMERIVRACMHQKQTIWPSQLNSGEQIDLYGIPIAYNTADIINYEFASNGLFYGINNFTGSSEFKTVVRPTLVNPDYANLGFILEETGYITTLISLPEIVEYTLFAPNNMAFENYGWFWNEEEEKFVDEEGSGIPWSAIKNIIGEHIVIGSVEIDWEGVRYMKTVTGNYLGIGSDAVFGGGNYDEIATPSAGVYEGNGMFYDVDNLIFPPNKTIAEKIYNNPDYSEFKALLVQCGLYNNKRIAKLISPHNTCFIPKNDAILAAIEDGRIPTEDNVALKKYMLQYFVAEPIFTDGQKLGEFATLDVDKETEVATKIEVSVADRVISISNNSGTTLQSILTEKDEVAKDGVIHWMDSAF